ncbi:hypothetical protein Aduo_008002 [Ancylostoma duodenale]
MAWIIGIGKDVFEAHAGALVPVELQCVARGKPRRYGLVCLPTAEDISKVRNRYKNGPVIIVQPPRDEKEKGDPATMEIEKSNSKSDDIWKDTVSTDPSTREKPISLKDLFPDTKVVDGTLKRKLMNRKKRENAKRRRVNREERLRDWNAEREEKEKITYRESANRLIIGRIVRGDFSFYTASGRALSYVPLCVLKDIRSNGNLVLLRNSTSRYYHPAKLSILCNQLDI